MLEEANQNWESDLQEQAGQLLAARLNPLKTEIEQLQASFAEVSARLLSQTQAAPTATETDGLTAQVRKILDESGARAEQSFQQRLQQELERVRADVSSNLRHELEAEFQTRLTQSNLTVRQEAETEMGQLRAQLSESQTMGAAAQASANQALQRLKTAVETIDAQRTQSEVLSALISNAQHFSPRVAFFVVKSGDAVGWKAAGFENGLNEETARSLAVSLQAENMLSQALGSQRTTIALNPTQAELAPVLGRFSHPVPKGAVAVPLVVRGKAAAVLFADSGTESDEAVQLEALEALVQVSSMAIELLPLRRTADAARATQPPAPVPQTVAAAPESPAPAFQPEAAPVVSSFTPQAAASLAPEAVAREIEIPKPEPPEPAQPEPAQPEAAPASFEPPPVSFESRVEEPAVAPPVIPQVMAPMDEPEAEPSTFEQLRGAFPEAITGAPKPVATPSGSYDTREMPTPVKADSEPDSHPSLPAWMQRLQESDKSETGPLPNITPSGIESSFTPSPPAPPAPPPVRPPSRPDWEKDLEKTTPLPEPVSAQAANIPAAPVSSGTPAATPYFSPPSEPPRFAAPSLSVGNVATETEVRAHNDARRFARLLVSEIKLYNASKVTEGRRHFDLYDRLKDEVDRSRKVYDKRVSPAVATKFDYFYDELVMTLAEGDPSKLGDSCPGPMVAAS